ncbi:MAG: hypothetical protein Tsb0010_09310 [Parvularculaceae bacterium]
MEARKQGEDDAMTRQFPIRPWVLGIAAAAFAATAAYALIWRAGAAEVRRQISELADPASPTAGAAQLRYENLATGGFPFFLRVDLDAPEIAAGGRFAWTADELSVHAVPHDPSHLAAKAFGRQIVTWRDGAGRDQEWALEPKTARASLTHNDGRERLVIELQEATALQQAGAAIGGDVAFSLLQISIDRPDGVGEADENILAGAAVRGLRVAPRAGALALATPISIDSAYAVLEIPAADFDDASAGGAMLARWLDSGPAFRLAAFEMTAGPLVMAARGALNIEADGHIAGEITARLNNVEAFVDMLAGDDQITEEQREGIIATLTLIGAAQGLSSTDGAQGLELPLTAQSGRLYVGPIAIAEIPRVTSLLGAR